MRRETLRGKFSQTVGVEKAEAILSETEAALGYEDREVYSDREVRAICEDIQHREEGYLSDVANEIRVHRQAEERFRTLLQNIPDPAVVLGFENERPVVRAVNDAFEATFGYGNEAASDEYLDDLIVPDDETAPTDVWFADADAAETEVRRITADGEERTFLFRAAMASRAGGAVEGYGIYTDITERKRRERKLHNQNDQLEQFVSVVSHDLRSPLSVAAGHVELARDIVDDQEAADHLAAVADAHAEMEALIDDLLTLAHQGRTVGEPERVDLATVCRMAWDHVETRDARLETEVGDATVAADPNRLKELFQNLFRNAVEHGSTSPASDGSETAVVRVGTLDDRESGFYVADNGPGIPAAHREAVFEHGFTTAESGTGFGLSIVESIAEAHGWSVRATDSSEGGARFEFTDVTVT